MGYIPMVRRQAKQNGRIQVLLPPVRRTADRRSVLSPLVYISPAAAAAAVGPGAAILGLHILLGLLYHLLHQLKKSRDHAVFPSAQVH